MNTCNATQQIPKRPDRRCTEVVDFVAKELLPEVQSWLRQEGDSGDDNLPEELGEMLTECFDWDGYTLAKHLDDHGGWSPDEQLVDILSRAETLSYRKHQEIIRLWVQLYGLKQQFELGQVVRKKGGGEKYTGKIVDVYFKDAQYVVECGSTRYIFNYEDVEDGKENAGTEGSVRH